MGASRDLILRQLQDHERMSVHDVAAAAGVSLATAHRHLARLEDLGLIIRRRGGAQIVATELPVPSFDVRLTSAEAAKQAIAEHALPLIPVGGSLFLDSSTTCLYVARAIKRSIKLETTVVTNSPAILAEFSSATVRVIGAPGELDQSLSALGGQWTVEFLAGLNLDVAFISGFGMTMDGQLTTTKRLIVDVLQQAIGRSSAVYVLLDSSKLGRKGLLDIVRVQDTSGLIIDNGISSEHVHHLTAHGIAVMIAH